MKSNVLVMGVQPGELLEPREKTIPDSFADRVLSRMRSQDAQPLGNGIDARGYLSVLAQEGVREVEIYGMWEDLCVTAAIREALKRDMEVRVPKGYTLSMDGKGTLDKGTTGLEGRKVTMRQDEENIYFSSRRRIAGIF